MLMESALHGALERKEITLAYQPRVRLQDRMVVGAEALMRWEHPELGAIPPVEFIPIAEETGLISALGTWALHEACRQAAAWRKSTGQGIGVSVNVSAHQLRSPHRLMEDIQAALSSSGMPASALEIELTESMVMAAGDPVRELVQDIRRLGVSVALDDFGTGYSSLAYLRQLQVDCLKIDRSFVSDLSRHDDAERVLLAILGISSALRLRAVAEGVEEIAQLEVLDRLGCAEAQGFLLAKPLSPAAFEALLAAPLPLDTPRSSFAA